MKPVAAFSLVLLASTLGSPLFASDHNNLDAHLPTELEDAVPIEYYGGEAQTFFRYERTRENKDVFVIAPQLEFGLFPNLQGSIHVPFVFGSAVEAEGIGQTSLELLYNFNVEGVYLPSFAFSEEVFFPTGPEISSGKDSHGVDPSSKIILTKTIFGGAWDQRLHLNLEWQHNSDRQQEERQERFKLVAGYTLRLGADTIGILDYVREQEIEKGKTADLIEIGLRRQLTPLTTVSFGGGAGLNGDSPKFRLTGAIQYSF